MIIEEARKWIGTPFHHQGRVRGVGVDCIGLIVKSYQAAGIPLRDEMDYSRYPTGDRLIEGISRQFSEISVDDAQTGDVLVMAQRRHPNHVMMYCKETDTVVHSYYEVGGVVEQPSKLYRPMLRTAFRHVG